MRLRCIFNPTKTTNYLSQDRSSTHNLISTCPISFTFVFGILHFPAFYFRNIHFTDPIFRQFLFRHFFLPVVFCRFFRHFYSGIFFTEFHFASFFAGLLQSGIISKIGNSPDKGGKQIFNVSKNPNP